MQRFLFVRLPVSLFLLFLFVLFGASLLQAQEATDRDDAKWMLWASGKTKLRGANLYQQEAYGHPWCSQVESSDLEALRKAGANFVNLSVPGVFDVELPSELNVAFLQELQRLIGFAKQHQLKVVLAFRTGPGRGEGDITEDGNLSRSLFFDQATQERFIAMWVFVAQKMKAVEHVVGYDLLVEPTWKESDSVDEAEFRELWRSLAKRTIEAIRSVDTSTPILVELDDWAAPNALETWTPLYGKKVEPLKKIVYAVHQYDPYEYTHEQEAFDPDMTELKAIFQQLKLFRQTYDVPLTVNEFGIRFRCVEAPKFLEKEFDLLEQNGINHAIWNWEPADASCSGRHFDINIPEAGPILEVVRRNWKANWVAQKQGEQRD